MYIGVYACVGTNCVRCVGVEQLPMNDRLVPLPRYLQFMRLCHV
jgi:hypothetical protein